MENRCWLNRIRGILLPASFVHLFFTITSGGYFFTIAFVAIFSIPCVARTVPFFQTWSEVRHDNAFSCPSPRRRCTCLCHIASNSVAYASVSVSCSRSCPLTSAGFRSCGAPPGSILRSSGLATFSICFPAHVSHIAPLPEVALTSAPIPTCSKIWEVCFDVNAVLDDLPSILAVLPAPATVHYLAVLPARATTMPFHQASDSAV